MLPKLKFKTFAWPQNPRTYCDRMTRVPHYRTENGESVYGGMSSVLRKIFGSGVFCGAGAYDSYLALMDIFEDLGPGELVHPIWGKCLCHFTLLELTQEPREDYVSYRFEFTGALPDGEIPQ